jgi:hypothetical protein
MLKHSLMGKEVENVSEVKQPVLKNRRSTNCEVSGMSGI